MSTTPALDILSIAMAREVATKLAAVAEKKDPRQAAIKRLTTKRKRRGRKKIASDGTALGFLKAAIAGPSVTDMAGNPNINKAIADSTSGEGWGDPAPSAPGGPSVTDMANDPSINKAIADSTSGAGWGDEPAPSKYISQTAPSGRKMKVHRDTVDTTPKPKDMSPTRQSTDPSSVAQSGGKAPGAPPTQLAGGPPLGKKPGSSGDMPSLNAPEVDTASQLAAGGKAPGRYVDPQGEQGMLSSLYNALPSGTLPALGGGLGAMGLYNLLKDDEEDEEDEGFDWAGNLGTAGLGAGAGLLGSQMLDQYGGGAGQMADKGPEGAQSPYIPPAAAAADAKDAPTKTEST
jgi:hypothetical protein